MKNKIAHELENCRKDLRCFKQATGFDRYGFLVYNNGKDNGLGLSRRVDIIRESVEEFALEHQTEIIDIATEKMAKRWREMGMSGE